MYRSVCAPLARAAVAILAVGTASSHSAAQSSEDPTSLPPVVVTQQKDATTAKKAKKPESTAGVPGTAGPELPPATAVLPQAVRGAGTSGLAMPLSSMRLSGEAIQSQLPSTSDTARLFQSVPGVNVYSAGGVSALPVINGLNDDRVKILVNGMSITSACANHMNPPLSYIDPSQVEAAEVVAGVTPVSKGGDSLGGTIIIDSAAPQFAGSGGGLTTSGSISAYYRSNGDGIGFAGSASAATQNVSVAYKGAWSKADNYARGDDGPDVLSTLYQSTNHALTLSARDGRDLFVVQGGYEAIPYQGYVNQYMDMVDNEGWLLNARAITHHDWGLLDARAFYHHTNHMMDILEDKQPGDMPMLTEGTDAGYSVTAEIRLTAADVVRIGNEFHHQTLGDWWPPICSGGMDCMMGPDTYVNINDGRRDRLGTFVEWERKWDRAWTTLLGARNDMVWMDAGDVQAYSPDCMSMDMGADMGADMGMSSPCDATAAAAFNARGHARTDANFDVTALARFEPTRLETYELGYARKTRSPNLYERYAWGEGTMASNMIGWYGDANGYIGNLDLEPEVGHTVSFGAGWRDRSPLGWNLKVTPYYTYVEDYIDADFVRDQMGMGMPPLPSGFVTLKFANHDARLYGVNVSGSVTLWESADAGSFDLLGVLGFVDGENLDSGDNLYHMMPINAQLTLAHQLGHWSNSIEVVAVAEKSQVNDLRNEPFTPGYALVNLRTSYEWESIRVDLGVENLFDKLYYAPLGGVDWADYKAAGQMGAIGPVPGEGRSFNAGVTMKF
jgi:iron complex outermembrane receptor protein